MQSTGRAVGNSGGDFAVGATILLVSGTRLDGNFVR
jgi:hypothetical protein